MNDVPPVITGQGDYARPWPRHWVGVEEKSDIYAALAEPFPDDEIEWRVLRSGSSTKGPWAQLAPYVTSRAIMHRLDAVVGPANWKDEYAEVPAGGQDPGMICTLSIRIEGEWVGKSDGAPFTQVERLKGGVSDALKRAAVKWGIGRDLYYIGETWAQGIQEGYPPRGERTVEFKTDGKKYWCRCPRVRAEKQPERQASTSQPAARPVAEVAPVSLKEVMWREDPDTKRQWWEVDLADGRRVYAVDKSVGELARTLCEQSAAVRVSLREGTSASGKPILHLTHVEVAT
jgi:hypothetical protein